MNYDPRELREEAAALQRELRVWLACTLLTLVAAYVAVGWPGVLLLAGGAFQGMAISRRATLINAWVEIAEEIEGE